MLRAIRILLVACVLSQFAAPLATAVTIPTVPVGDVGNPNDGLTGFGGVDHEYRMAKYEVTNGQYAEFLNAKAPTNALQLYNSLMGSDVHGGITRGGAFGSYFYSVKANMADKPVNWVSWMDALRFANWMQNGQGSADTETGAYTLLGGTAIPSNITTVVRNPDAIWFLPTESEWYKAAYYQPTAAGGDADGYWFYATRSNTTPVHAGATSVGVISNPGANVVNYEQKASWGGVARNSGNVTTVGSAGPLSTSYYGTFDQNGNVFEWNESISSINPTLRGYRGGSWGNTLQYLQSTTSNFVFVTYEESVTGFRLAAVPEPSTFVLAGVSLMALAAWGVKRRRRLN